MPLVLDAEHFYLNGSQVITLLYPLLAENQLPRELLLCGGVFFFSSKCSIFPRQRRIMAIQTLTTV